MSIFHHLFSGGSSLIARGVARRRINIHNEDMSYSFLASIIRIAHKYQVDSALSFGSNRLVKFFSPGAVWIDAASSWSQRWEASLIKHRVIIELEDAVDAVGLFRLIELHDPLPFALYLCCLCEPLQRRNGVVREDKSVALLSDEDYTRCAQAMVPLSWECHAVAQRAFSPLDRWGNYVWRHSCTEQGRCKEVVARMWNEHAMDRTPYPLSDLFVRMDYRSPVPKAFSSYQYQLCASCRKQLLDRSVVLCREVLADLPKFFGLQKTGS